MAGFSCPSQYHLHLVVGFSCCSSLRSECMTLFYPCRSWSPISALFEHVGVHFILAPVMCTTPTSNVNHTVTKTVLLFSSKRCEQLICHLLHQNWSLFVRVSNPLATRKLCMVRWLLWAGNLGRKLLSEAVQGALPSTLVCE